MLDATLALIPFLGIILAIRQKDTFIRTQASLGFLFTILILFAAQMSARAPLLLLLGLYTAFVVFTAVK